MLFVLGLVVVCEKGARYRKGASSGSRCEDVHGISMQESHTRRTGFIFPKHSTSTEIRVITA